MILPDNMDETLPAVCNTAAADVLANVKFASTLPLPWLKVGEVKSAPALLIGGGPSVRAFLPSLQDQQQAGASVFAMNGTREMLAGFGIISDYFVLADSQPDVARYVGPAGVSLISSQCNRAVFDADPDNAVLWHPNFPGVSDIHSHIDRVLIGGGSSVGLLSMSLAYVLGFRDIHLYGYDSSYAGDASHAYPQSSEDAEEVTVNGAKFMAAPWMTRQAVEFQSTATQLADLGVRITVHGSGLLPAVASFMTKPTTH